MVGVVCCVFSLCDSYANAKEGTKDYPRYTLGSNP